MLAAEDGPTVVLVERSLASDSCELRFSTIFGAAGPNPGMVEVLGTLGKQDFVSSIRAKPEELHGFAMQHAACSRAA